MTRKEARRPGLVQLAVAGTTTTGQGARAVGVTDRDSARLCPRALTGASRDSGGAMTDYGRRWAVVLAETGRASGR